MNLTSTEQGMGVAGLQLLNIPKLSFRTGLAQTFAGIQCLAELDIPDQIGLRHLGLLHRS